MAKNDFSKGPVWKCIVAQAVPLTVAQLVQLLYNIVDRIYLGHMGDGNSLALTGVGLTFPIVTLISAFSALFGNQENHRKFLCAAVDQCGSIDGGGISVLKAHPVCVWCQRRFLCICCPVFDYLHCGHSVFHDLHGYERLHQCPGIP